MDEFMKLIAAYDKALIEYFLSSLGNPDIDEISEDQHNCMLTKDHYLNLITEKIQAAESKLAEIDQLLAALDENQTLEACMHVLSEIKSVVHDDSP